MTAVNYDMRVKTNSGIGLNIRSGPGIQNPRVGGLSENQLVHCTELQNGWYKNQWGWSDGTYLTLVKDYGGTSDTASVATDHNVTSSATASASAESDMEDWERELINSLYSSQIDEYSEADIDDIKYLFGAPFQFTELTDPRPKNSKLGRIYMSTLLSDMSMLVITPGKAAFMKNFSSKGASEVLKRVVGSYNSDDDESSLTDILKGKETGRYYSFESDYVEYMKYVNNMCWLSAQLLGIGDQKMYDGSKTYNEFDWSINNLSKTGASSIFNFLTTDKCVAFFIDGKQSSFSDGNSNSTDSSMLASAFSKGSDWAKELQFLFGKGFSDESLLNTSKDNYESAVSKIISKLTSNSSLATQISDRVSDHATTLINGGNIAFPEVWKDSNYNKSYNIEIKLVCPYADIESFYLHILVPIWHIIALAYPRQLGANGYINPFLVRAFCKGWFNCSMGMVESVSIKRASQEGWSVYGFPTEVDVSISIKDMYSNLTLSRQGDYSTFHNIEFMDMVATWCGVNLNKPELERKLEQYGIFTKNKLKKFFPNLLKQVELDIANKIKRYMQ